MGNDEDDPGDTGSGRGGPMGTPDAGPDLATPDVDQERNAVVSGGGVVNETDDEAEPSNAAEHSPSSQEPGGEY